MREFFTITDDEANEKVKEWVEIFRQNDIYLDIWRVDAMPICAYNRDDIRSEFRKSKAYDHYFPNSDSDLNRFIEDNYVYVEKYDGFIDKFWIFRCGIETSSILDTECFVGWLRKGMLVEDTCGFGLYKRRFSELTIWELLSALCRWSDYMLDRECIRINWRLSYNGRSLDLGSRPVLDDLKEFINKYQRYLDGNMSKELKSSLKQKVQKTIELLKSLALDHLDDRI